MHLSPNRGRTSIVGDTGSVGGGASRRCSRGDMATLSSITMLVRTVKMVDLGIKPAAGHRGEFETTLHSDSCIFRIVGIYVVWMCGMGKTGV